MAGQPNPKKIKFEAQKEILDKVADEVVCSICQLLVFFVPRGIPLYVSPGGNIVCSTCKNANPDANFQQNDATRALDKVLSILKKFAADVNTMEIEIEDQKPWENGKKEAKDEK